MKYTVPQLEAVSTWARLECLNLWKVNHAPLGGSFSILDVYVALFLEVLDLPVAGVDALAGVRIIPKGTSANAHYAVMKYCGLAQPAPAGPCIESFPPVLDRMVPGVHASVYKCGTGLEQGIGMAVCAKRRERGFKVFVFLTDGELQCGTDHQARLAAAFGLDNITVVLDFNRLQSFYPVELVDPTLAVDCRGELPHLRTLWQAYGWDYSEVDGHDHRVLAQVLSDPGGRQRPRIIVAKTVKGKGIPFMEGKLGYHHDLSPEEFSQAEAHIQEQCERLRPHLPAPTSRPAPTSARVPEGALNLPRGPFRSGERLADTLSHWLWQFRDLNGGRVYLLNTDNPTPFDPTTPVYPGDQGSAHLLIGINERVAVNVARGIANEGAYPIYVSPAPHLQVCAEEMKHCGLDRQSVLLIGYAPGSDLCRWGPGHNTYQDCALFAGPNTRVFQPATAEDLVLILEGIYGNPMTALPAYLRLPKLALVVPPLQGLRKEGLASAFQQGHYCFRVGGGLPGVVFVASGQPLRECIQAASLLLDRGISSAVVNVLNLTRLDPRGVRDLVAQAEVTVAVMDADPDTLVVLLRRCLDPRHLANLVSVGVTSYGEEYQAEAIYRRHGMDSQSLVHLAAGRLGQRKGASV